VQVFIAPTSVIEVRMVNAKEERHFLPIYPFAMTAGETVHVLSRCVCGNFHAI